MLKKSLKYLTIAGINLLVLTGLLALWTDRVELTVDELVRQKEFLEIIGFSILSLIVMRISVSFFRRRYVTDRKLKVRVTVIIALLISSGLYIDYSKKVISNVILNRKLRNQIGEKIHLNAPHGSRAEKLTIEEYEQITKMLCFPKLPAEASNIEYNYSYDGFLPDYLFRLVYDLPAQIKVDTMSYEKGDYSKYQSFEIIGDKTRVTYTEFER